MNAHLKGSKRWIVPEVVQSSAMDCGPASLKSLLEGFGISVSYGRLREACQTEIDGTSIDTLETVAQMVGLDAEQIMVPADFLLLDKADLLPALVVVQLPNGTTHFVIAWNRIGSWIQIMDPATGRRWQHRKSFLRNVYQHSLAVSAEDWTSWSLSDESLGPLKSKMKILGLRTAATENLLSRVREDGGWKSIATLGAAIRFVESLVQGGGIRRGAEAEATLQRVFQEACPPHKDALEAIPKPFWSVLPAGKKEDGEEMLRYRGAVLVRVRGHRISESDHEEDRDSPTEPDLPPELQAALSESPPSPLKELARLLLKDGISPPLVVVAGLVVSSLTVMIEALLYRGLLDAGRFLSLPEQRFTAIFAIVLLLLALLALSLPTTATGLRLGRRLEARLRMAFMGKVPCLADRYFRSRLISDMAERAHVLYKMMALPPLTFHLWRTFTLLMATTAGIIWLDPESAPIALAAATAAIALPLLSQKLMVERDLRVRTHTGALSRFFLDSLMGLTALRCHAAEKTIRREHETYLTEWARSSTDLLRISVAVEGITVFSGYFFAVWILFDHFSRNEGSGMVLLLVYWVLSIPTLGENLASAARQIPTLRNIALRVFEPLAAPDEQTPGEKPKTPRGANPTATHLQLTGVSVVTGGHTILEGINLEIAAGSHVAIVGSSGAGKSSLIRLFLGLHTPSSGAFTIDGKNVSGQVMAACRLETAWVDPSVHLWNRTFMENIFYGGAGGASNEFFQTLEKADLLGVLESLPHGLQTVLGEGGGLLSGGEGQRLRFLRALNREGVRLAILDEPFRGLAREQRRRLLKEARHQWREKTLLWVTHDLRETLEFDRIIVVEEGRVVEDGPPELLKANFNSRFSTLLAAEDELNLSLWGDPAWRRLELRSGTLGEKFPGEW